MSALLVPQSKVALVNVKVVQLVISTNFWRLGVRHCSTESRTYLAIFYRKPPQINEVTHPLQPVDLKFINECSVVNFIIMQASEFSISMKVEDPPEDLPVERSSEFTIFVPL